MNTTNHTLKDDTPLISVLVCNYNYGGFITECLDSIQAQDYPRIEIVIVDDGSDDDSVAIIDGYDASREGVTIRKVLQKRNRGICYARNTAIESATGELLIFVDSDDTIPADYLTNFHVTMHEKAVDVVYGDAKMFGDQEGVTDYPEFTREIILTRNIITISSLVRRSAIGLSRFDLNLNRKTSEDYDFWLGMALKGVTFAKHEGTRLNYRIQDTSRNQNEGTVDDRLMQFIEVWRYSLDKYRELLKEGEYEQTIFAELGYRIHEIGSKLTRLNREIHDNLVPEIRRRAEHIEHLNEVVRHADHSRETAAERLAAVQRSRAYRIGTRIAEPYRFLKDKIRGRR